MKINGSTTGNVELRTRRNTPALASQSFLLSRGCDGGSGILVNFCRISSSWALDTTETSKGGIASAIMRCALSGLATTRTARSARMLCPRSLKQAIKYITASITPHATLHPSAPKSISRTSIRPSPPRLKEQVMVSTIMSPNNTSAILSIGSRRRFPDFGTSSESLLFTEHASISKHQ